MVAEVVPSRVRPGNWVRLVVGYDVSGLLPGEVREVVEIRRLAAGGVPLETFEHREQRPAGRVTSELPVKVPYDAAPGVYSVGTTLRLAGAATHSTTAVFLVTTEGEFR